MNKKREDETPAVCGRRGYTGVSKMKWLVAALSVCALISSTHCATGSVAWCYHEPTCNDTNWPTIAPQYCNGSRQSPINIVSASAQPDSNLTGFTMQGFSSTTALGTITNTGKTVKVSLSGVSVSGGGLSEVYNSLQFHLHWGDGTSVPGSEHTVDGKRYPMEMHIVNIKASHNGNVTAALQDPTGLAALGFFIEEMSGDATGQPASWQKLSSYLANITNGGDSTTVQSAISLNDLISGVNTSSYYRYLGSLTTPTCNEAVVWTVFKDTVKVSRDVINRFSTTIHITNSSSPFVINVYRNLQSALPVTTQATGSAFTTCYSLGLIALCLILGRS